VSKVPYLVSAVYAEVIDQPQVYETEVEASSVEEAEQLAQLGCIVDNGGDPADGEDSPYRLTDIYARPAHAADLHMGTLGEHAVAAHIDQGIASLNARLEDDVDGIFPEVDANGLLDAMREACDAWDRVADMLPGFREA
jgi:hypothetical protein